MVSRYMVSIKPYVDEPQQASRSLGREQRLLTRDNFSREQQAYLCAIDMQIALMKVARV
jgi:hypothetical protein